MSNNERIISTEVPQIGEVTPDEWLKAMEWGDVGGTIFETTSSLESPPEQRPVIKPDVVLAEIKAALNFREAILGRQIEVLGFGKGIGAKYESYKDRIERERREKGIPEAAFFGEGDVGDTPVEVFGMDFRFISGSLSTDGGARFQEAVDVAIEKKRPLIALYSSAGARQQENGRALVQLRRMVHASNKFKKESSMAHIGVLIGQVWGGISAGSAPVSNLLIALRGTDYGFSGPRVIQAYTGEEVPEGEQSVETHMKTRLVDVLVADSDELMSFLTRFLTVTDPNHKRLSLDELGYKGENSHEPDSSAKETPQELDERYLELRRGTRRPDTKYLIENVFEHCVPLFNNYQEGEILRYPAIIAAVGKIGSQPFLIVGNQPSYYLSGDGQLMKIPSSPEPKDYAHMRRMMRLGEKLRLPLVLFTDTLGAKPTLEAEKQGQPREIAEAISAVDEYPHPVISVVLGGMGSGGGLATSIGDQTIMLKKAMLFVSEPQSAASILYSTPNPTAETTMLTTKAMEATAVDQLQIGLIDEIVAEGNKEETAAYLREAIARNYAKIQNMSQRRLMRRRDKRARVLGEFPRRVIRRSRSHGLNQISLEPNYSF